jgi:hypothetical protein
VSRPTKRSFFTSPGEAQVGRQRTGELYTHIFCLSQLLGPEELVVIPGHQIRKFKIFSHILDKRNIFILPISISGYLKFSKQWILQIYDLGMEYLNVVGNFHEIKFLVIKKFEFHAQETFDEFTPGHF